MKRILTLSLALLCLLSLAACGAQTEESLPDSFVNASTGVELRLRMTREEADKLLGAGVTLEATPPYDSDESFAQGTLEQPYEGISFVAYGSGADFLVLSYREARVCALSNYSPFSQELPVASNWKLKGGLGYGASRAELMQAFGDTQVMAAVTDRTRQGEPGVPILTTPGIDWQQPVVMMYCFDAQGKRVERADAKAVLAMQLVVEESGAGLLFYALEAL